MGYTLDNLQRNIQLYGYSPDIERLELDNELLSCMEEISKIDTTPYEGYEIPYISKFQMKQDAKRFMNEKFRLHPVGYLSKRALRGVLKDPRIQTIDDISTIYNQAPKWIDPFQLPIQYKLNSIFGGLLVVPGVVTEDPAFIEEILPKLNVYFMHVNLPKTITPVATMSYVHEITHSQLESHKGIIEDYYNEEMLSIFMELLQTYEKNPRIFEINFVNRVQNLLINFYSMYLFESGLENPEREYTDYDYFHDSQYFVSILEAFQLLHLYVSSNDSIKKYIQEGIQKVFDGDITLEMFLDSVDIHYRNSLNPEYIKSFIKK